MRKTFPQAHGPFAGCEAVHGEQLLNLWNSESYRCSPASNAYLPGTTTAVGGRTPNQNRKRNVQDPTLVLGLTPATAVALQKVVCRVRPPASDWVIRKIPWLTDLPSLDDR